MKKMRSILLILLYLSLFSSSVTLKAYSKPKPLTIIDGLIELKNLDTTFSLDLKYATKDNFTKRILYKRAIAIININTAKKLIKANNFLKKYGYHIKIYDAYRPYSVQKLMWKIYPNKKYLADPKVGSNHNRGCAVDITMVDKNGVEAIMPSKFDDFSEKAHINYAGASETAIKDRELLAKAMTGNGFRRISNEWWHFDDLNYKLYPILDIGFDRF
jgi:zinc D-Ala-D-Ala dipeptidase